MLTPGRPRPARARHPGFLAQGDAASSDVELEVFHQRGRTSMVFAASETILRARISFRRGLQPLDTQDRAVFDVTTHAAGPVGSLPLTPEMLRERPSGDLFGWTQNAGMGWNPSALGGQEFLISQHPRRNARRRRIADRAWLSHRALGSRLARGGGGRGVHARGRVPFAGSCTDPCDGRTQGTPACSTACRIATTRRRSSAG